MSNKISNSSPVNTKGITYSTTITNTPANVFLSVPAQSGLLWRFSLGENNKLNTQQDITLSEDFIVNGDSVTFTNSPQGNENTVLASIFHLVKSGSKVLIGTSSTGVKTVEYSATGAPFIIINGYSPISFPSYYKAAGLPVQQSIPTNPLTSVESSKFNNISDYLLSVYSGQTTFSEMGLLNALTDASGPNPISLSNISIRKEYVSDTIYGKTVPVTTNSNQAVGKSGSIYSIQFNCNTQNLDNFDPAYQWVGSDNWSYESLNNFIQHLMQSYNPSFSGTDTDLGDPIEQNNIGLVVGNATNGSATYQSYFLNNTVTNYGVDRVGNRIMEILFSASSPTVPTANGWTLEIPNGIYDWSNSKVNRPDAYSIYLQSGSGYLNTGSSFWENFGYSDNVVPAFYCFGMNPDVNYDIWTQTANSVLIFCQGTIQMGSQRYTSNVFSWSSDQVISTLPMGSYQSFSNYWGLSIPLRQQFPLLGCQQLIANSWGGVNWNLVYEESTSTRQSYSVPIYFVTISNKPKLPTVNELGTPNDIISKLISYYKHLSLTLSSFFLGKHNIKILQLPDEEQLLSSYTNMLQSPSLTFSSTVSAQAYGLIYLTAVKNGNGINVLTELFNGYPFSSIPKYAYSIMNEIANSNQLTGILTVDQLNSIIYSFYTMTSLTSINSSANQFSDIDPSIIKSVMNQVDGGYSLMSFAKEVLTFLSSLSNVKSAASIASLQQQWTSITSNWNKSGLSAIVDTDPYCYHDSVDNIVNSVSDELGSLNDLIAKNLTFDGNKDDMKVEFKQILSNHHLARCSALNSIISQLSDDFLLSNPWKELGEATLDIATAIGKMTFSLVKFMMNITANIFTGVSNFVSTGSIVEEIFNDTSILLANPAPNYPDIFNTLGNAIVFDQTPSPIGWNPFLFDPFRGSIFTSAYTIQDQGNGLVSLLFQGNVCYKNLTPNSITRTVINTPIGKASIYIDLSNSCKMDGTFSSNPSWFNIVSWMVEPSIRPDGKVDVLKTLYRQVQLMKYSLLMINPNVAVPSQFEQFFSNPAASNYVNHMSIGEITAIDSVSAATAAAYLSKAVIDGFHLQADSAIGYGIYAAENLDMLVEATLQYEKDEASNVANAYVQSQIQNIRFFDLLSGASPVDMLYSSYIVKTYPSIIKNNVVTSTSVATPVYSPDITNIISMIAIDIGKFAAVNYVQHKLFKTLSNHISAQKLIDAKTSKITIPNPDSENSSNSKSKSSIKSGALKMLLNKYHRDKNKKNRCNALNNQSTSINDSISATGNAITNAIGQTTSSLSDDIASISNIWGVS